ncbi:MAG: putative peptidoglycan glycosyltransferase FtsW [Pseudomonadota bacterium]
MSSSVIIDEFGVDGREAQDLVSQQPTQRGRRRGPSRLDTSSLAHWWWSVDTPMILIIAALMAIGMVLLMAAGPSAAARISGGMNSFHFPLRQAMFIIPALAVIVGVSMMSPLQARRLGSLAFLGAGVSLIGVLLFAPEINGAHRWFVIGSFMLQPSEFFKPGFIVVAAWMLSETRRRPQFPGVFIAMALFIFGVGLLALQPDFGQACLLTAIWMVMFFVSGWNLAWLLTIGTGAAGLLAGGYYFSDHLAARIQGFLDPASEANYQVNKSIEAIAHGGLMGNAGDPANVKLQLPDAHTDFIFAVAGEHYGFFFCLLVIGLYAAFMLRAFYMAARSKSVFVQCAVSGLGVLIGLQAFINMAVALRALPAKGMTLPFISYGGSSLLAVALSAGLLLAFTRQAGPGRTRREIMP